MTAANAPTGPPRSCTTASRRYEEAAAAARRASRRDARSHWISTWVLPELVEAAVRGRRLELARDALERLAKTTRPCGTEFALGIEARCRALLSDGRGRRRAVSRGDRAAGPHPAPSGARPRAPALRRVVAPREPPGRRARAAAHGPRDARRRSGWRRSPSAHARSCWRRARRCASGRVETRDDLTAQEWQIARLARDGLSNPEIGARLFLSPRTVEWHLRNVFTKLGIRSRRELASALAGPDSQLIPA